MGFRHLKRRRRHGQFKLGWLGSFWCKEKKYTYICFIHTPNLGLAIAIPGREMEQGRFRGSTAGVKGHSNRTMREHEGAPGEQKVAVKEQQVLAPRVRMAQHNGSLIWLPLARLKLLI